MCSCKLSVYWQCTFRRLSVTWCILAKDSYTLNISWQYFYSMPAECTMYVANVFMYKLRTRMRKFSNLKMLVSVPAGQMHRKNCPAYIYWGTQANYTHQDKTPAICALFLQVCLNITVANVQLCPDFHSHSYKTDTLLRRNLAWIEFKSNYLCSKLFVIVIHHPNRPLQAHWLQTPTTWSSECDTDFLI